MQHTTTLSASPARHDSIALTAESSPFHARTLLTGSVSAAVATHTTTVRSVDGISKGSHSKGSHEATMTVDMECDVGTAAPLSSSPPALTSPASCSAAAPKCTGRPRSCHCRDWEDFYWRHGDDWKKVRGRTMSKQGSRCCKALERLMKLQHREVFSVAQAGFYKRAEDHRTSHSPPKGLDQLPPVAIAEAATIEPTPPPMPSIVVHRVSIAAPCGEEFNAPSLSASTEAPPQIVRPGIASAHSETTQAQGAAAVLSSMIDAPAATSPGPMLSSLKHHLASSLGRAEQQPLSPPATIPPIALQASIAIPSPRPLSTHSFASSAHNELETQSEMQHLRSILHSLDSLSDFDGFISYRHQPSGQAQLSQELPFGVTAAGMFRLVAEKHGLRLWQDIEHLPSSWDWNKALQSILNSCHLVFVLLWKGSLERCKSVSDPMRIEILTSLRRPQCFVVPVVLFTDRVEPGGVIPHWLDQLVTRAEVLGGPSSGRLTEDELDSLHIYHGLLQQQCCFLQKHNLAGSMEQFFRTLPHRLGVQRHAAAGCHTLDKLGVTVGMQRPELERCYASYIQSKLLINHRVVEMIEKIGQERLLASSAPMAKRVSMLVWNMFGGSRAYSSDSSSDPIEMLLDVLRVYPVDVLALQEAPWGVVDELKSLGYSFVHADIVFEEEWKRDGAANKRRRTHSSMDDLSAAAATPTSSACTSRPEFDVQYAKNRMEQYNVIAVRLPASDSFPTSSGTVNAAVPLPCPSSYPPLATLQAQAPIQAVELSKVTLSEFDTSEGGVVARERRVLQMVRLQVGSNDPSAAAAATALSCSAAQDLCIWNTHLEVSREQTRWESAQQIVRELDFHAGTANKKNPASGPTKAQGLHIAGANEKYCAHSSNQILVGDLNSLSRRDYTEAEVAYHSRVESFLHGLPAAPPDSWRVMELLEDTHHWIDLFTQAEQPRPKISVWSCRRVDHALAYPQCLWTTTFASQIATGASDHLPHFFVLQPSLTML